MPSRAVCSPASYPTGTLAHGAVIRVFCKCRTCVENEPRGLRTALTTILKKETLEKTLPVSFQRPLREGNLHGTGNGGNTDIFFFH